MGHLAAAGRALKVISCGLDYSGSGLEPVAGPCRNINKRIENICCRASS